MKPYLKTVKSIQYSLISLFVLASGVQKAAAQTDADALMIPQKMYCSGLIFSHNTWTDYWEGTFKRDNGNIGKLTTNTYSLIGNYGLKNNLNILYTVPYVETTSSAGTLKGQHGLQDLSFSLKWLVFTKQTGSDSKLRGYLIGTGNLPLSNYEADFEPMSIGLHCRSLGIRTLVNYNYRGLFFSAAGQYNRRDDITIDRTSYYTTQLVNSNQVYMPDANNISLTTGYLSPHIYTSLMVMQSVTLGGFDIRKNDMPFPSNNMNATIATGLFKYSFDKIAGLELTANAGYVLKGRNVGQATSVSGGILYLFKLSKTTYEHEY